MTTKLRTIYTASKCKHFSQWIALREAGYPVISTWINEAGPGESSDLADLADRCIKESAQADITLLYCEKGETLKGALMEAGSALSSGKQVHCVGTCENLSPVLKFHPNWKEFSTIEEALSGYHIPRETWRQKTKEALAKGKYHLKNEIELHEQISRILTEAQIPHQREVVLSPKNRIDFLLPHGLGIEVKINKAGVGLIRQGQRYTAEPKIQELMMVTIRPQTLPDTLGGKPLSNFALWNLLDSF